MFVNDSEEMFRIMDQVIDGMLAVDFSDHEIPAMSTVKLMMMDKLSNMVVLNHFPVQALTPIIQKLDVDVSDDLYKENTERINGLALKFCEAIGHAVEGMVAEYGMEPAIIMMTASPINFHLKVD